MVKRNYRTEQRKELLNYLIDNSDKFISAEEIDKHLKKQKINVSLTTVYRFLNSLEKEGKLRIELKDHTKYYQYILEECDSHYHLKCKKCGEIIHFSCKELEDIKMHILKDHKFKMDSTSTIYGICEKCM